ncbi:sialidase family protein [Polynucleobacter sp. AP-Nino-20-G2]|uniref:sialidase family protein n=1 Tax=Polynucleobacter sp. AP-Nino-20-G2 TaxID=2576917 RepID=UPI001BFD53B7|nr:sialidase family protein [Polynucleobacter sp. AP-Nino-20-G2]QWE17139.1 exo-alpha-sialidase [Polynucleobacter sp. AP-Nino-20-G2]
MVYQFLSSFSRQLFGPLLLSLLGTAGLAQAQMNHSSMAGASSAKLQACEGFGLDCANAATPFLTKDGNLLLAWASGGKVSVAQSSDLGKRFTSPIVVAEHGKSLDAGSDARPQIVSDSKGNIFLAYAFFKDSNWNAQINTAHSSDGGLSFTAPTPLIKNGSSERFPSMVIGENNSIFLAWIDKRLVADAKQSGNARLGGSIAYSFSNDAGKTFQPEKIANEQSCECCRIGSTIDPKGGVAIVYRAIFPGGIRDHATQLINESSSGKIRRVSKDEWRTDACPHHGPAIAVSGTGKYHVAWFTQGSARSGVFYANSSNQGEVYSKPSRIGSEGENISRPYLLALDQSIWLVWKVFDGVTTSVYLKQSPDDGVTWSQPSLVAQTSAYSDHPLLISNGSDVFLSWLTRADGYQVIKLGSKQ